MSADGRFAAALRALTHALNEIGQPSMIIGGVAVIAAGVPRGTIDIDATVLGRKTTVDGVIDVVRKHDIEPRIDDAETFAREHNVLLLRHRGSGITVELSFAWLPFEEEALARAREVDFEGTSIRVAGPEDLIVYKATAWRDRDKSDIELLLVLHLERIDLPRVRDLITQIGTALDDPERITAFDQIVARARAAR